MSLFALLADHPFGGDEALVHTIDRQFTKAELLALVDEAADALDAPAGTQVPVVAEGVDMLVGMFACWRNNQVFVPVNPRDPHPDLDLHQVHDPAVAFVTWTSGTTGRPKPILHTHDAYLEIIDRVLTPLRGGRSAQQSSPSPNLIPVSMALNAGIYNALFGLRAGAPLVLMDRFSPSTFAALVARHEIRSTVLPPPAIAMLNDDSDITKLEPLRYVRSITAALSPFQATRFTERFGVTVLNGYGQAEIGEVVGWTAADAKAHPDKIGAVGRAHPGVELRIEAPDGNGVGELLVRPPNTAKDLAADRVTDDGYVRTGDLARIDDEGFVWIEGRRSDLINRGGNKVFPAEVEEVLCAVPGVREAAVVGTPDERLGEVPVAFVVGASDADLDAECRRHLVPYKVPVRFEWVDELPRSAVGKILRAKLLESG